MHEDEKNGETVLTVTEPLYPALHVQPATTESPSELAGQDTATTHTTGINTTQHSTLSTVASRHTRFANVKPAYLCM